MASGSRGPWTTGVRAIAAIGVNLVVTCACEATVFPYLEELSVELRAQCETQVGR